MSKNKRKPGFSSLTLKTPVSVWVALYFPGDIWADEDYDLVVFPPSKLASIPVSADYEVNSEDSQSHWNSLTFNKIIVLCNQ